MAYFSASRGRRRVVCPVANRAKASVLAPPSVASAETTHVARARELGRLAVMQRYPLRYGERRVEHLSLTDADHAHLA